MAKRPEIEGYDKVLEALIEAAAVPEEDRDTKGIMNNSLSSLLDAALTQRDRYKELQSAANKEKAIFEVLEWAALAKMEAMGTEVKDDKGNVTIVPLLKAGGMQSTATVTEADNPSVKDWDAFYDFMKETDQMYLVQKRAAAAACRELWEMGEEIPGVEKYVKRTLSLRKA